VVAVAAAGCAVDPGPPEPPDGADVHRLQPRILPGMTIETRRSFTSREPVTDTVESTAWREDVYRTTYEQVDPDGRPTAARRIYDRAFFRLDRPDGEREESSALAGRTIHFRPGLPPQIEGEDVPVEVAVGLTLRPFDEIFLPDFAVWPGATWTVDDAGLARFERFLGGLGLTPGRQQIRVGFDEIVSYRPTLRVLADADRPAAAAADDARRSAAKLSIDWTAFGRVPRRPTADDPTTSRTTRVAIRGTLWFDLRDRLIVNLSLTGVHVGTGTRFDILLQRRVVAAPVDSVLDPPDAEPAE
jgi:hypothetical protein